MSARTRLWIMALTASLGAMMGQPAGAADQSLDLGLRATVNTSYFLPEFAYATFIHPKRLLATPALADKPLDAFLGQAQTELGFDLRQLDEVIFAVGHREQVEGEEYQPVAHAIIFRSSVPFVLDKLHATILDGLKPVDDARAKVFIPEHNWSDAAALVNDRLLILAREPDLKRMLDNKKADSPLLRALVNADPRRPVNVMVAAGPFRQQLARFPGQEPPPPLEMALKLLTQTSAIEGSVHADLSAEATIRTQNATAAAEVLDLSRNLITAAKLAMGAQILQQEQQKNPRHRNNELPIIKAFQAVAMSAELKAEKNVVIARLSAADGQAQAKAAVAGIVPMLSKQLAWQRNLKATSQLREIVGALHLYEADHGKLPPAASVDKNGKPLLSWRVHLLPHFGETELYQQFKLDEPWDSPHNKALVSKMPAVYRVEGSRSAAEFKTPFLAVRGKNSVLKVGDSGKREDLPDGTPNSAVMVRVTDDRAVTWTRPDDYEYDPQQPAAGLAKPEDKLHVAFADGRVRVWPASTPDETLRRAFQTNDGQKFKFPPEDDPYGDEGE